ncbi:methyltransferase FkbM family [Thalassoporum mexicanum PCC 7367]|uniref:FkbM family methyltransferase n=1 Tax=Thalassoporum mexicanum TaxID=3457544 RepID=UPI00029FC5F4|nr:FkbM family methyltransferase [Pseudanabaena sp. PCC 7367]AFY69312.1 methyltransferase FkbM family [Pseudanabaena sp. PCC 7367]
MPTPLDYLRHQPFFVKYIQPRLDITFAAKMQDIDWRVYVRLVRNITWVYKSGNVAPTLKALFLAIDQTFQPKVFWDVGANIGYFSWLLLSHSKELEAVLFEPDLDNINLLRKTIAQADFLQSRVQLITSAVSDRQGKASFAIDAITGATGSIDDSRPTFVQMYYDADPSFTTVDTVSLDQLWQQQRAGTPDLIKIDIEGSEDKAIAGAWELIEACQPILVIECMHREIIEQLAQRGYHILDAGNPQRSIKPGIDLLAIPDRHVDAIDNLCTNWQEILT